MVMCMRTPNPDYLKQLRIDCGLTQQEVADRLGVTKSTISKYEKGQRKLKGDAITKLANIYGVEPVYILTGNTDAEWRQMIEENVRDADEEERAYWESELLTDAVVEIMPLLDQLNEEGQAKAVERIAELTEIPRYRRD